MTFLRRTHPDQDLASLSLSEAKKKIMDLVAGRDHSEKELRKKLSSRCDQEIIDQAMAWANEQNWLASPDDLKEKIADQLNRRGKGVHKINEKLEGLGLEPIKADPDSEIEKAKKLALQKWSPEDFQGLASTESQKLKAKVTRYLASRGFDSDVVSTILKEELKAGAISYDEEY